MFAEALAALNGDAPIARADLQHWIDSGDLLTWSVVYQLASTVASRIQPPLKPEEQVEFTRRYLLRCIEENPAPGDHLHGGYEAAWELATELKEWRQRGGRIAATLRGVSLDLEKIYRRGDPATQNRIVCGVMEHAFEDPAVRRYFADWERDADLKEAYQMAVEWGAAHE